MDRANLPKHRDQMKQLLEGKIESAEVNTGYVHAQGLLVPLAGTIKMVRRTTSRTTSCSTCARASRARTRIRNSPEAAAGRHEAQAVAAHQRVRRRCHRLEADVRVGSRAGRRVDLREP